MEQSGSACPIAKIGFFRASAGGSAMNDVKGWTDAFLPLLQEGHTVAINPIGSSMFPLFIHCDDQAVLAAADVSRLRRGDVVMYRRDSGMLVLHRIWRVKKDGFYMVGDNQTQPEGPLRAEQIMAVMVSFVRNGRQISCKNPAYVVLSRGWLFLRPFRHCISRPLGSLYRFLFKKIP
jgi:hypothetical protein